MNKKEFLKKIFVIFEDRNLKIPSEEWLDMLFRSVSKFSDEQINTGINTLMNISPDVWKERYFNGKPPLNDWIRFFQGEQLGRDDIATLEVNKLLKHTPYYGSDVIFDNPTTNACLEAFGGVNELAKAREKGNRSFLVKELKELWLACYNSGKKKFTPCAGESQPLTFKYVKGVFSTSPEGYQLEGVFEKRQNSLEYVGDKNKCLQLMEQKEPVRLIPNFKKV